MQKDTNGSDNPAMPSAESAALPAEPAPANDALPIEELQARFAALAGELAAKSAEFAAFRESALRQVAEAQNQRRRADNDALEARKYGTASLARDVLAIADNLRRALDAAGNAADDAARVRQFEALRQGVEMTEREIGNILQRHGVKRIDPAGQKFDPNLHQAMFEVESADATPGSVVEVVQAAYTLHDRLLRPALVGVAKAKAVAGSPADGAAADGAGSADAGEAGG
jgi:molecular chaperone GrpE